MLAVEVRIRARDCVNSATLSLSLPPAELQLDDATPVTLSLSPLSSGSDSNAVSPVTLPLSPLPRIEEYPFLVNDFDIPNLSEDEIIEACMTTEAFEDPHWLAVHGRGRKQIACISKHAIVKFGVTTQLAESQSMTFVAANNTSIHVPKVLRAFRKNEETYIVLEFIPDTPLTQRWDDMDYSRQERICDQVVDAIVSMQDLELKTVGPIGGCKYFEAPYGGLSSISGIKAKKALSVISNDGTIMH